MTEQSATAPRTSSRDDIATLIINLYRRPRRGELPPAPKVPRADRPYRRGLPLLCLAPPPDTPCPAAAPSPNPEGSVPTDARSGRHAATNTGAAEGTATGPGGHDDPAQRPRTHGETAQWIEDILRTARPGVPRAVVAPDKVDTTPGMLEPERVRRLLLEASTQLKTGLLNSRGGPRFRRFGLLNLLMDPRGDTGERSLLGRIQNQGLTEKVSLALNQTAQARLSNSSLWAGALFLLRIATLGFFRIAVTGRVPLLSGPYRWFVRSQPHLAPELSGSFPRFALRLTPGHWEREAPEFLSRLLVNAFLEDLRQAWRSPRWEPWAKRWGTYAVLVLDGADADNDGFALLQLINSVRNQVGLFDPLLVIATGCVLPPEAGKPKTTALPEYEAWRDGLAARRQRRGDTVWYLPIWHPSITHPVPAEETDRIEGLSRPALRTVWWSRRLVKTAVPLAVAALIAGPLVLAEQADRRAHCDTTVSTVHGTPGDCVGVSDGTVNLFGPADPLSDRVQATVAKQNAEAEQAHRDNPQRPYLTLAVLQAYTSSNGTVAGLTSEREALSGAAVAQRRQLDAAANSTPIVRLLVANGGSNLHAGPEVAEELRALAETDHSIVGVVGLDLSRIETQRTVAALSAAGIPMVASTLTADQFAVDNPMFVQVGPNNAREAAVLAGFANQLAGRGQVQRSARVYAPADAGDIYATNLRDDLLSAFTAAGFPTELHSFTPNAVPDPTVAGNASPGGTGVGTVVGNAAAAGREACAYQGVVLYAGRAIPDFNQFVDGAAQCGATPVILADDDVSRHVAEGALRRGHLGLPYYHVSLSPELGSGRQGAALDFYSTLVALFDFEYRAPGQPRDGYAALAFDATQVFVTAAEYLGSRGAPIPVNPGTVWREIAAIHSSAPEQHRTNDAIVGVSGTIDYGGDVAVRVPEHKTIAIVRVADGEVDAGATVFCGIMTGQTEQPWCPK